MKTAVVISFLELEEMGFEIEASHHEVAPGQHEIDFKYADALTACDKFKHLNLVVKTIARKHGLTRNIHAKTIIRCKWFRNAL